MKISKLLLGTALVTLSVIAAPKLAFANSYGANNMGGGTYLTWLFQRQDRPRRSSTPTVVGYACVTRDALLGMARVATVHRYQIVSYPGGDYLSLQPLNGAIVSPSEGGFTVAESTPFPEQEIWNYAQTDVSGNWFRNNGSLESVGRACVDSGVAGALNYLEDLHGVRFLGR